MSISNKVVPAFALAALFTFVMGGEAHAQHGSHCGSHYSGHFGGFHSGFHGGGHFIQPAPYVPSYPSYPTYPSPGFGHGYHDTTHLDYHGPSLVPHNGHLDYRPGHYDVHRTGHWH